MCIPIANNITRLCCLCCCLFCFICFSHVATAKSFSVPYCTRDQLGIYPLAVNYPGMSQSSALYGVINLTQTPCKLYQKPPIVWIIDKKGRRLSATNAKVETPPTYPSDTRYWILPPLTQKKFIDGKRLVWFSLHGGDACYDPRGLPEFDTIHLSLPGLPNHQTFTVSYRGYTACQLSLTGLQHDIHVWQTTVGSMDCSYESGKNPHQMQLDHIYVEKTAQCG